jgi:twinkle protein
MTIRTAASLKRRLEILHAIGLKPGDSTGWPCVDELYTVAPGQMTVVTGWPGSGKSEWMDALACNLIVGGWSIAFHSPENRPIELHLSKLLEKWTAKPFTRGPTERMTEREAQEAAEEIGANAAWLEPDDGEPMTLEAICAQAGEHFSLVDERRKRGLVIDPWNELDHRRPQGMTETEYISIVLGMARTWARDSNVHLWIVAHPAKQPRENGKLPVPRPDMIAGSQHFWNKADNAITVWRDYGSQTQEVDVHVLKVRFKHIGRIGTATLHYDRVTGRYHEPMRDAEGRVYEFSHGGAR